MAFDVANAFNKTDITKEQAPLVAELGMWGAIIDGELVENELGALVGAVSLVPGLEGWGVEEVESMIDNMNANYADEEAAKARVFDIVATLRDPKLQRCAYQLVALCTAADGNFSDDENEFLQGLQEAFDIPDDVAEALVREAIDAL